MKEAEDSLKKRDLISHYDFLIKEVERLTAKVERQNKLLKKYRQAEERQAKQARYDYDSLPYYEDEYDR